MRHKKNANGSKLDHIYIHTTIHSDDVIDGQVLRRPLTVYEIHQPAGSAIDSIILGMTSQAAEEVDSHFSKQMTVHLFSEKPPHEPGLDLPSITLQRGRDHGLPGTSIATSVARKHARKPPLISNCLTSTLCLLQHTMPGDDGATYQ